MAISILLISHHNSFLVLFDVIASVYFILLVFLQCVGQASKVHETITFLLASLPNIHLFQFFSLADSAIKLFNLVIKNLTIP